MAKSRTSAAISLPEVRPGIRKLAEAPRADLLALWREIGTERRKEILVHFFSTVEPALKKDAVELLCKRAIHGFRAKSLLARKPEDLAALVERAPAVEPVVHQALLHWAYKGEQKLGWLYLMGLARPDAEEDGENIVPLRDDEDLLIDHRELDNAALRLFAVASAEEAFILLLFHYKLEPRLRPGLKDGLKRLLATPLDELTRRGRELLDEWDPREDTNKEAGDEMNVSDEEREGVEAEPEECDSATGRRYANLTTPDAFEHEVVRLRRGLNELAAVMEAAARAARECGAIPSDEIAGRIQELRESCGELVSQAHARMTEAGLDVPPREQMKASLDLLIPHLTTWRDAIAQSDSREEALAILRAVIALRPVSDDPLPSLAAQQQTARDLLQSIEISAGDSDALIAELRSGTHPLARLLAAVRAHPKLDATTKTQLGTELTAAVGVDLAFAVILGQIKEGEQVEAAAEPSASDAEAVEHPPEPGGAEDAPETSSKGTEPEAIERGEAQAAESEADAEQAVREPVAATATTEPPSAEEPQSEPESVATRLETSNAPLPPAKKTLTDPTRADLRDLGAGTLSQRLYEVDGAGRPIYLDELAARLAADGYVALAHHLIHRSPEPVSARSWLPAWLTNALVLAPHVSSPAGRLFSPLRSAYMQYDRAAFRTGNSEWDLGLDLLLVAATLRPALLAPNTMASQLLMEAQCRGLGGNLRKYCQFIGEHTQSGHAIDPFVLKSVKDQASWNRQLEDLRARTKEWMERAPRQTTVFAAGTKVWQLWTRKNGFLHELLRPVAEHDMERSDWVRSEVERLSDPGELRRLVDETDRQTLRRTKGQPIIARAYTQIQTRVGEALDLAREWLVLLNEQPGQEHTYRIEQADRIRREALAQHPQILKDLAVLRNASPIERAGAEAVCAALRDIEDVFSTTSAFSREEPDPVRLLNRSLLRVPSVSLDQYWQIEERARTDVPRAIAEAYASGLPEWLDAYKLREEVGDHVGTDLLLRILRELGDDVDDLEKRRLRQVTQARDQAAHHLAAVRQQVDQAVMHGLLREADRARLSARVMRVEEALAEDLSFHLLRNELDDVERELGQKRDEQVAAVKARIAELNVTPGSDTWARFESVLEQGDVLTANEFVSRIREGKALPPAEEKHDDLFARFFPGVVRELTKADLPNAAQIVRTVRDRGALPGVDYAALTKRQAELAADMLHRWFRMRGARGKPDVEAIQAIFGFLGFNVLHVDDAGGGARGRNRLWFVLDTEPVRDRTVCPVAYFGSGAAGDFSSDRARYRVLSVWDEPTVEDLIGIVGEKDKEQPTIVLYFGRMNVERRRKLARLVREQRRTFIVLDEVLLLHLAAETRSAMATFFTCALPFTYLEPYVTTAGFVPPEMFYGRDREIASVIDPYGSCFIYGGRQLGKTALLRHVERRFHAPARGQIAVYIDLKTASIAFDRPVDDFWMVLAERFKDVGVIERARPERILDDIRSWLGESAQRRILLLLDEADRFLEADKNFTRVDRLKGVMEQTDRRFKVVLAGLHNVQRSTRVSNNPLAHLGEPLCIGPLFDYEDRRGAESARDLVTRPLAAVGYRFESADLVTRILSQTNFYPSLLQLYCAQLLRHVRQGSGVEVLDSRKGPPYEITTRAVEDAYQSRELWERIRERFLWTLDLDQRYRLIALIIAYHSHTDETIATDGMSVRDVRQHSLDWWPQGFEDDRSDDCFRVLLDEMVGLGILRLVPGEAKGQDRYTLRSANVGLLMGTVDEIEDSLVNINESPPSVGYDPSTSRRPLSQTGRELGRYSPLTAQQEAELQERANGVTVVFGTEAAGLSDLNALMPLLFHRDYFVRLGSMNSRKSFRAALGKVRDRKQDGVTLYLVGPETHWDAGWVFDAAEKIVGLRSRTSFVRFLFVADPQRTWSILRGGAQVLPEFENAGVTTVTLRPWHDAAVRAWLDDLKVPADMLDKKLASVRKHTGRWPALLYELERELHTMPARKWDRVFEKFSAACVEDAARVKSHARAFGLDVADVKPVLQLLAVGPAHAAELAEVASVEESRARQILQWASLLALVSRNEDEGWTIDPIVARTIEATLAR